MSFVDNEADDLDTSEHDKFAEVCYCATVLNVLLYYCTTALLYYRIRVHSTVLP